MYQQPYDPYGYQSYNDPQPDHYTSTGPGMPYPAAPPAVERHPSVDHTYSSYQDQYFNSANSYDHKPYGYPPQPNQYPPNPTLSTSQPEQYPPPHPTLSPSSSFECYPPVGQTNPSLYPSVSSSLYPAQNAAPPPDSYSRPGTPYTPAPATDTTWPCSYGPKPTTTPAPAPLHGHSKFDTNKPNPYLKVPPAANFHLQPPYGKHGEHHEGTGNQGLYNSNEHERRDNYGHGHKQEEKKENISFSVEEAQNIIKNLKETIKNLSLQLTNSRESTAKLLQEKGTLQESVEFLQKETDDLRAQISTAPPAFNHKDEITAVEREWMQKLSLKEQEKDELLAKKENDWVEKLSKKEQEKLVRAEEHAETIAQLEQNWTEKLASKEEENSALLARVTKLQSDSEDGRAFLLETNAAQEAELLKLREETAQRAFLLETNAAQEAELLKLRDETAQLLDETTQLVDEKDIANTEIERLKEQKLELEELLSQSKASASEFMELEKTTALKQQKLSETVTALEKELEDYRDLCEERRLRIEELETGDLPSLKSNLESEAVLLKKTKGIVAELEDKLEAAQIELEDCKQAYDNLEQQLHEIEEREMENNLRVAGETRSSREELERLRSQLDSHLVANGDSEKRVSELSLEGKLSELKGENRQTLERISILEKSLEDVTTERDILQEELGLIREAYERETQEAEEAAQEYRLQLEELEAQISSLTSAKSSLETRATDLETQKMEVERILHATEDMFRAVKEESESLRTEMDSHVAAKGDKDKWGQDKGLLEEKLASLEDENVQLLEQISELEKNLMQITAERDVQMKQVQVLQEEKSKLMVEIEAQELILEQNIKEIATNEADLNSAWGELQDLGLKMNQDKKEMDRLRLEISNLTKARADLEERNAIVVKDRATALASASTLGTRICQLETEIKEWEDRYSAMSLQYAEAQAERDELVLSNRNLRNK